MARTSWIKRGRGHVYLFIATGLAALSSCICVFVFLHVTAPGRFSGIRPPPLPCRAFFITTQARHASNWTAYTLSELTLHLPILNITSLEVVFTTYNNEFGHIKNRDGIKPDLAMTFLRIWEKIITDGLESAWIFEDDVVFHDDFDHLLPLYWAGVPSSYEFVYLGHGPMGHGMPACQVTAADMAEDRETDPRLRRHPMKMLQMRDPVYCTHAMAISNAGARRASRAVQGNMWTTAVARREPYETEIKTDLVLEHLYRFFLDDEDKLKWIVFDPTVKYLSKWAGFMWCRMAPMEELAANCTCETCLVGDPGVPLQLPLYGTGLIYNNNCKVQPGYLEVWRSRLSKLVASGIVNPDPIGGKRSVSVPFKFWSEPQLS